ncbi:hypothetical protein A6769_31785 [Nostoc punctiforme NIES-2108]|uniref:DNA (cytosine-5-)-methyltransferase n=1 Tax=Nostoc punctiforme NIES-2108 TaxID=1356359 RepID=A0A367R6K6_NOSPU|nr:hypothetical protein A6769_31785 [Nostoc punctiforme NIES-2108]
MKSVLSLFSGIGGLCHHGISAARLSHKFRVQQFVEISPYSQSKLRHEQPGIPIHADITNYHCQESIRNSQFAIRNYELGVKNMNQQRINNLVLLIEPKLWQ